MTEDDALIRFGLPPGRETLAEIRRLLRDETRKEQQSQGAGDTELMRVLCVQLFAHGLEQDVLLIWRAKAASMDANASIDIELLCGPGLGETRGYLGEHLDGSAAAALARIESCQRAGNFEGFSPADSLEAYVQYYAGADRPAPGTGGRWSG